MKSGTPRDRAASVRQRLLNIAKERGEEFNFVLLPPDIARFVDIFREVAAADVDDGVTFLPGTVAGASIREEAIYDGIRITLEGRLGVARIPLQVDVGFGDAVTPAPVVSAETTTRASTAARARIS